MRLSFRTRVLRGSVLACLGAFAAACTAKGITVSDAQVPAAAGMVDVATLAPDIRIEMRYAGNENFVGEPIDGYQASKCYLHAQAAQSLARVQARLRAQDRSLVMYDCYRPVRAVQHFVRWARDIDDQRNKARYYPAIDKRRLFELGYIAEQSGHSRGATLDLGLLECSDARNCRALDMGTGYDLFDPRSHTDSPLVSAAQRANRDALRDAMAAEGFVNYTKEWWHYTFKPEPTPDTAYDFVIR